MLEKLKQRWKVNGLNLVLVIFTFALGGSLCGYAGRRILELTAIEKGIVVGNNLPYTGYPALAHLRFADQHPVRAIFFF